MASKVQQEPGLKVLCCRAVLDNLPEVPPEKFDKLAGVIKKIISQVGVRIREGEMTSCCVLSLVYCVHACPVCV